jgi:HK97 family phage portal protein
MFGAITSLLSKAPRRPARTQEQTGSLVSVIGPQRDAPRLGTGEMLKAYSQMPWLRAVVGKVGVSIGSTRWCLYVPVDPDSGKPYRMRRMQRANYDQREAYRKKAVEVNSLQEIEDHPLLDLLEYGNSRLDGSKLFQLTQQYLDLVGEAYWVLSFNRLRVPSAIWPLPPDWVKEIPTPEDPVYTVRIGRNEFKIPMNRVIAFVDPDPSDPYGRGTGLAKSLGDELETDEYTSKHLKSFFQNSARPDLIITADGLRKEDTIRMEEMWTKKLGGVFQRFKPFFMNRKVEVKEIGQSFEAMQMVDLRKHERDMIVQVFGIPPEKLGILQASNRATIQASDFFWTKDVLVPRLESIRRVLQQKLVPLFDDKLVMEYESPVVQDRDHQVKVMEAQPGAFTLNEWRALADLPSLGEPGDIAFTNPGVQPYDIVNGKPMPPITYPDQGGSSDKPKKPPKAAILPTELREAIEEQLSNEINDFLPAIEAAIEAAMNESASA